MPPLIALFSFKQGVSAPFPNQMFRLKEMVNVTEGASEHHTGWLKICGAQHISNLCTPKKRRSITVVTVLCITHLHSWRCTT